jgi:hypothetical protein
VNNQIWINRLVAQTVYTYEGICWQQFKLNNKFKFIHLHECKSAFKYLVKYLVKKNSDHKNQINYFIYINIWDFGKIILKDNAFMK